jgi:cephalosporin hydroxylase
MTMRGNIKRAVTSIPWPPTPAFVLSVWLYTLETILGTIRGVIRRVVARQPAANPPERFVPLSKRPWFTDLPVSRQFLRTIQNRKLNVSEERPPILNWRGALLMKDPFELSLYPMLLQDLQPRTIVEIGAYEGASATWLAGVSESLDVDCHIYSFESHLDRIVASHPRVSFMYADANNLATFDQELLRSLPHPWLFIEDAHVNLKNILAFFDSFLRPGDYMIVEDTLLPWVYRNFRRAWPAISATYRVDTRYTDMFGYNVTWNFNSYLRKIDG